MVKSITRVLNSFKNSANPDASMGWLEWRAGLLTVALWCALVCGGAAFWGSLLASRQSLTSSMYIAMSACTLWLLVAALASRLPYWLRAASLLCLMLSAGIILVYFSTLAVVGICLTFSAIILSFLLLGWRAGFASSVLSAGCLALVHLPAGDSPALPYFAEPTMGIFLVGSLSALAASASFIPLALYYAGSSRVIQRSQELQKEADDQQIQYQQFLAHIAREYDTHLLSEKSLTETISLLETTASQEQILKGAISLFVSTFGYQRGEIFYRTDNLKFIHAVYFIDEAGTVSQDISIRDVDEVPILVQQIAAAEQPVQIAINWASAAGADIEAGNVATAWVPITAGRQTNGILKISKHQGKAFSETEIAALNTNARLLGLGIFNLQLSMVGQVQPGNISSASQAIQLLNHAETSEQIQRVVKNTFRISTFPSIQFGAEKEVFQLVSVNDPAYSDGLNWEPASFSRESIEKLAAGNSFFPFQLSSASNLPEELTQMLFKFGWTSAALIPIYQNQRLNALYILGSHLPAELTPISIQPYASLAGYATSTLEKVVATRQLQRRVAALQSLATISQSISVITELDELYDTVHEQIKHVIGDVDLAIALYDPGADMISIPYAHEAGEKISLEPFPLGQGLTSILLHSQQPLMIVEDTEQKAKELGAKVVGASAKSWLGVPMIVSGEIMGAIILQDIEKERRFDDDDLRLMTTLSSQVAITIRNIRLLKEAKRRADKERIISSITTKIWTAPDVESVTRTALQELGRALHASSGRIKLDIPTKSEQSPGIQPEDTGNDLLQP